MSNMINSANVSSLHMGQTQNVGARYSTSTRFPVQNVARSEAKPVLNHPAVNPSNPVACDSNVKRCYLCDSPFRLRA